MKAKLREDLFYVAALVLAGHHPNQMHKQQYNQHISGDRGASSSTSSLRSSTKSNVMNSRIDV